LIEDDETGSISLPLGRGSDRSLRTRFGLLLTRQRDRQFEGLRIVKAGTKQRAQQWRLLKV
jgi:hypothetical protein